MWVVWFFFLVVLLLFYLEHNNFEWHISQSNLWVPNSSIITFRVGLGWLFCKSRHHMEISLWNITIIFYTPILWLDIRSRLEPTRREEWMFLPAYLKFLLCHSCACVLRVCHVRSSTRTVNDATVVALSFSPCGQALASGSTYGDLRLWDLNMNQVFAEKNAHDLGVTCCCFSPRKDKGVAYSASQFMWLLAVSHGWLIYESAS